MKLENFKAGYWERRRRVYEPKRYLNLLVR
jgi:hypothetical protein